MYQMLVVGVLASHHTCSNEQEEAERYIIIGVGSSVN